MGQTLGASQYVIGELTQGPDSKVRECAPGIRCYEHVAGLFTPIPPGVKAITVGHVIFCRGVCSPAIIEHELGHVKQYEENPLFPAAYGWEAIFGGIRCDNKHEREIGCAP